MNKNNILGNSRLPKERFVFEFDIDIFVVPQNKLAFQWIFNYSCADLKRTKKAPDKKDNFIVQLFFFYIIVVIYYKGETSMFFKIIATNCFPGFGSIIKNSCYPVKAKCFHRETKKRKNLHTIEQRAIQSRIVF